MPQNYVVFRRSRDPTHTVYSVPAALFQERYNTYYFVEVFIVYFLFVTLPPKKNIFVDTTQLLLSAVTVHNNTQAETIHQERDSSCLETKQDSRIQATSS